MLLRSIERAWAQLWDPALTRVGGLPLRHFDAQVVGKMFQELLGRELRAADPRWQTPRGFRDPDFLFDDEAVELKLCGQPGKRVVFGNRCSSHGHAAPHGKSRDTWVLTINYSDARLNLIRLGRVSASDWIGQKASSGNASRLCREAYETKLAVVRGAYQRLADPRVLRRYRGPWQTVGEAADAGHAEAIRFLGADYYL